MQLPPSSGFSLRSGPSVPPPAGRPAQCQNNVRKPLQAVSVAVAAAALGGAVVLSRPADAFAAATVTKKKLSGAAYWEDCWKTHNLGWHLSSVNSALRKYSSTFIGTAGGRVLVPLCGKTVDLAFLKGCKGVTEVVGVEYVASAIDELAKEQAGLKLVKDAMKQGSYAAWKGDKVTVLNGDFLKFSDSKKFDRVWDRGSLVALEPSQRSKYASTVLNVLAPGGQILLVTFERVAGSAEGLKAGPPFSVTEEDVKKLYGKSCTIKKLESVDVTNTNPRWKAAGLTKINEVVYLITKEAPAAKKAAEPAKKK